jgi:hypothetical protein
VADSTEERPSNRLASETSAYLRQHMHNPVDWYPWGPEALERAGRAAGLAEALLLRPDSDAPDPLLPRTPPALRRLKP